MVGDEEEEFFESEVACSMSLFERGILEMSHVHRRAGNPMERKVVSQRASRPLGVPQPSMGSSFTTSKKAWAAWTMLNCRRQYQSDINIFQPPTVQASVFLNITTAGSNKKEQSN